MKNTLKLGIVATIAFLSHLTSLFGAEPIMKSALDAIVKKRDAAIQIELKPLKNVHDNYTLALKRCKETAQSEGDLDTILAANTALEAQDRSRAIGVSSDSPKVRSIQQTHKDAHVNMLKQIEARMVAINRNYYNQLDKLVKELTQAGMVNEALEIRKIKDEFIEQIKAQKAANVQNHEASSDISTAGSKEIRAGTATNKHNKFVVIDAYHGSFDARTERCAKILKEFHDRNWKYKILDKEVDASSLSGSSIYFCSNEGMKPSPSYKNSELALLENYYRQGQGCMIITGMCWVWVSYAKSSAELMPGNQLGIKLGFNFLPSYTKACNADYGNMIFDGIFKDIKSSGGGGSVFSPVIARKDAAGNFLPLMHDEDKKVCAGILESKSSAVVILGHNNLYTLPHALPFFDAYMTYIEKKLGF